MIHLANERQHFLGRLKKSPIFLALHTRSLLRAVLRKLKNRVRMRVYGQEHGAKEWPQWLERVAPAQQNRLIGSEPGMLLPSYPSQVDSERLVAVDELVQAGILNDPEAYMFHHRWGFLLGALLKGEKEQAQSLARVESWIEQYGEKQGAAWETYSACERVANLLVYLAASSALPASTRNDSPLFSFVGNSIDWIAKHVEYYGEGGTNNHIINNARALVLGGAAIADDKAFAAGMRIFRRTLPEMVMSYGFLRERSSHYQLVVLNWVLDAAHFCTVFRGESSADARFLRGVADRMASAASLVCNRDGFLEIFIGDISPDTEPVNSALRLRRLYPTDWPVVSPRSAQTIQDGWFRTSSGRNHVVGNFPPGIFPPQFPTHGHADYTSFTWLHDGIEMLIDTGRCSYVDEPISRFQQSAPGHNVPLVNGYSPVSDSLIANGRWWPLPYAFANLQAVPLETGVQLEHNGFGRATPARTHVRKIIPSQVGITVVDTFVGTGKIELTLCWNFGDGFEVFDMSTNTASGPGGEIRLTIDGANHPPIATFLSGATPGSWLSKSYGEVRPALGVGLNWTVNLPAEISTRFEYTKCVE